VTTPKAESWWYSASSVTDTAGPARVLDEVISQASRESQAGWWGYRDPAQQWFRTYVELQSDQEGMIELATQGAQRLKLYDRVARPWMSFLGSYYAAYRYAEYGMFMALCYAQREALSDVVANPILFQAVDKERHAQDIALHCMALEEMVGDFSDATSMDIWMQDPIYQPVRRYVELLLACRDWAEILVAINLCFEPLVGKLFTGFLFARQACAFGDPVTPLVAETVEADRQRSADATGELARFVIANRADNRPILQEWIERWMPLAHTAAAGLHALARPPHEDPASFQTALETVAAEQSKFISSLGLTVGGAAQ
jgi:methane monooxygenase component A beta chain/propane monooxygenase small subunit